MILAIYLAIAALYGLAIRFVFSADQTDMSVWHWLRLVGLSPWIHTLFWPVSIGASLYKAIASGKRK